MQEDVTSSKTPVDMHISNNEERVKFLGVNLEGRLNFDFHVNTLLKKASKKDHQFSQSHSRALNNRINKTHVEALRLVYKDEGNLSLDDLLKKDKLVFTKEIYKPSERNLQSEK